MVNVSHEVTAVRLFPPVTGYDNALRDGEVVEGVEVALAAGLPVVVEAAQAVVLRAAIPPLPGAVLPAEVLRTVALPPAVQHHLPASAVPLPNPPPILLLLLLIPLSLPASAVPLPNPPPIPHPPSPLPPLRVIFPSCAVATAQRLPVAKHPMPIAWQAPKRTSLMSGYVQQTPHPVPAVRHHLSALPISLPAEVPEILLKAAITVAIPVSLFRDLPAAVIVVTEATVAMAATAPMVVTEATAVMVRMEATAAMDRQEATRASEVVKVIHSVAGAPSFLLLVVLLRTADPPPVPVVPP